MTGRARRFASRHPKKLAAFAALVAAPLLAHGAISIGTRLEPPPLGAAADAEVVTTADGVRRLGRAYARRRGKILEVRLAGDPETIGHQHGSLMRAEMVENEGILHGELRELVPVAPLRWLLEDIARLRYRAVDRGMSEARRREIAARARAFSPDPYEGVLPTYHRFVFLEAIYDISLGFEQSPLLGCTSIALGDGAFEDGRVALARNFDFEAGAVFDHGKAVFLVHEDGAIPYASVAWPGLVGAFTGMNAAGLSAVVHGARAREPGAEGEPVLHTVRELLARARTTDEAVAILERTRPMVSHLLLLVDARGEAAVVERAPGEPLFVRRGRGKLALTNHLEGPLADDPKNRRVEERTSTHARRQRIDELLSNLDAGASVERVVGLLRDRKGLGGTELPLGDRRAIDALIATHGVVMDVTARALWVSEGPHLAGEFIRFDLARLLDPGYEPSGDSENDVIPVDPILNDGAYDAWVKRGSRHDGEERQ